VAWKRTPNDPVPNLPAFFDVHNDHPSAFREVNMMQRCFGQQCFAACVSVVLSLLVTLAALPPLPVDAMQDQTVPKLEPQKSEAKKPAPLPIVRVNKDVPNGEAGIRVTPGAAVNGEVEIQFYNGSMVRMVIQSEKLEIATPYGNLSVPVEHIRAIEFGLHFPEGTAAKIELAVKNLSSSSYKDRDNASNALVELGPFSFPAVYEATKAKDAEVAARAKEIVKKLQAKHNRKDLKITIDDKVVTPTFTITGRILTPSIKVKTEYFGEAKLELTQMRTLRALGVLSADIDVKVDAATYANAGQWLNTKYQIDGHTPIVITAKGLVDALPQQPGQQISGPNGMQGQMGGRIFVGGGGGMGGGAVGAGRKIGIVGQMHAGMLLGKIGENGEPFMIGERYEDTPEADGTLYLHIGPSPFGCPSSGSYDVKIGRKN
jgi:hypothetical protein